jgi:chromosome partitioning protein
MRVLAITNQKGGVGKTTTAVNLAASLAAEGLRVLMIDLDPQGNATTGSGITKKEALPTVYQLLIGAATLAEVCIKTDFGFDVLPANRELAGAEVELIDLSEREYRLKNALQAGHASYDFILIDCPPALNMLTVNGLVAADSVMIPMQCEYYALEGLDRSRRNPAQGARPPQFAAGNRRPAAHHVQPAETLTQQVSNELESHFGNKVYKTIVPRNVRLAEAPSYGKPVIAFDKPARRARKPTLALAKEILEKDAWHDQDERTRPRPRRAAGRQRRAARRRAAQPLPVERLQPGKYQPRTQMDKRRWKNWRLRSSAQGVMQPILARAVENTPGAERYEIVAGERRWRAAQIGRSDRSANADPRDSRTSKRWPWR